MDSSDTDVVNFGKSIIVPSVQELAKQPIAKIPPRYVRPEQSPPPVTDDLPSPSVPSVPVIDLHKFDNPDSINSELDSLHSACKEWGFFQVINHGISASLLEEFKLEIENFLNLSYEEKKEKFWQRPDNHEGFGQLFVLSEEQKLDWSDMFYITTLPHSLRRTDLFGKLPTKLRETLEAYSMEMKNLALLILDQMGRALKMDAEEIRVLFTDGVQSVRMNYYPPCPEPEMAIGFTPHSDAVAVTILFQLNQTEGLQIRKDGRWVPIKPLPNAFVVNIGGIMEIVSNGLYRSIEHRAIVNSTRDRLSVATFYSPKLELEFGPAPTIIGPNNPATFRRVPMEKYFKEFFARKLNGKSYLDFMRMEGGEQMYT